MKKIVFFVAVICLIACKNQNQVTESEPKIINEEKNMNIAGQNIYSFSVEDIEGNRFNFIDLKDKKIMIVNTASECGLTPQYKELQMLYEKYKNKNFVIIGFPSNNFGGQEPGTNDQIATFCSQKFGVSFPMMSKISVKGSDMHPIYEFLTQKKLNGLENSSVEWNFQKYLIGNTGKLEKVINPRITPMDETIQEWIRG